jgi:hypothetical protein
MIPLHFRQSNSAQQAMEIERPCLQILRRSGSGSGATLTQRRRRCWPRRRRPRLMAPLHFRQSNSVQQAMEIERPCLQMLRRSGSGSGATLTQRRRRYWPRRRRPRPMIPLHFPQSNSVQQAMEIERSCLQMLCRPLRVLSQIKTLTWRSRRYWPTRRRPRLVIPLRRRQSNPVRQAMEIERPCLQMPLRQPLRVPLRRRRSISSPWRPCRTAITSPTARRRPRVMARLHFQQSNSVQQAMEIERPCLQAPLRQPLRFLPRTKTLRERRRRYWPRRRRPRLMAALHFRRSNPVQQAMETERPCLQMPLRQPLRVLRWIKTLTVRRRRYWPRRRRPRLMAPLHGSSRVCPHLRRSASF